MRILVLLLLSVPCFAEIYKYVDENGRVHYTDEPPEHSDAQTIDIEPLPEMGTVVPDGDRAKDLFRQDQRDTRVKQHKQRAAAGAIKARKAAKRKACDDARRSLAYELNRRSTNRTGGYKRYSNRRVEAAKDREDEACKLSNFR